MKIAFIQKEAYEKISVHCLAGALKSAGHECRVFIEDLESEFEKAVFQYSPDYLAVSLYIGEQAASFDALRRLRKRMPSVKTLVGGPFALVFPDIFRRPEIDYLFRGDGELVLPEFLYRMEHGLAVKKLSGLSFVGDENTKHINNTLDLNSLADIPVPDRDLYYRYDVLKNKPTKMFVGSRGCPYRCTYCYNAELANYYNTPYWRVRPINQVIQEIQDVEKKYGLSWVHFVDGTFNANRKWLAGFLNAYAKADLPPFLCNCRVENIDEDLIRKMKAAGCDRITFGIQSGNPRIRQKIAGRKMTNDQIIEACRLCQKYAIRVGVDIIFGWPGETLEEAMDTIRLCREIKVESYSSNVLIFYPGLRVTRYAVENKYISREPSLEDLERRTSNTSPLLAQHRNVLINLDKWFFYLIKYPWIEPLIMPLLRLHPNELFNILKNIHHLKRSLKYDTNISKLRTIINYMKVS